MKCQQKWYELLQGNIEDLVHDSPRSLSPERELWGQQWVADDEDRNSQES
jgi:hypothetical protein